MEIEEKYNYDLEILNLEFRYSARGDTIEIPKIIILVQKAKFDANGDYSGLYYFTYNFLYPNNYIINLNTRLLNKSGQERYVNHFAGFIDVLHPNIMELRVSEYSAPIPDGVENFLKCELIFSSDADEKSYVSIYCRDFNIEDTPEPEFMATAKKMLIDNG